MWVAYSGTMYRQVSSPLLKKHYAKISVPLSQLLIVVAAWGVALPGEECLCYSKKMTRQGGQLPVASSCSGLELGEKLSSVERKYGKERMDLFPFMMWSCFCSLLSARFLTLKTH